MQRSFIALLLIFITAPVWAQNAIPGTFRTLPPQTTPDYFTPILTPPEVSFGSGVSGPVIVNRQAFAVTVPQGVSIEPSIAGQVAGQSEPITVVEAAANSRALSAQMHEARFDFIVAPGSGSLYSGDDQSLGELAASIRKGPPPTQRNFTNDDISRMNGTSNGSFAMPANSAPKDDQQTVPKPPQQKKDQTLNQHSPFAPPPISAEQ
jgi:hypothetical protein